MEPYEIPLPRAPAVVTHLGSPPRPIPLPRARPREAIDTRPPLPPWNGPPVNAFTMRPPVSPVVPGGGLASFAAPSIRTGVQPSNSQTFHGPLPPSPEEEQEAARAEEDVQDDGSDEGVGNENDEMHMAVLELLAEQVDKGHRKNNTFTSRAYTGIQKGLKARFDLDLSKDQVRNKVKWVKRGYNIVLELKDYSGAGWDDGMVILPDETWADILRVKPKGWKAWMNRKFLGWDLADKCLGWKSASGDTQFRSEGWIHSQREGVVPPQPPPAGDADGDPLASENEAPQTEEEGCEARSNQKKRLNVAEVMAEGIEALVKVTEGFVKSMDSLGCAAITRQKEANKEAIKKLAKYANQFGASFHRAVYFEAKNLIVRDPHTCELVLEYDTQDMFDWLSRVDTMPQTTSQGFTKRASQYGGRSESPPASTPEDSS